MKKAVIISCFDWYENRIKPIEDILKSKEYEVNIIMSDFSHIEKKYIEKRFNSCIYIHVPKYTKNISISRIKSHLSFGKQVNKLINEIKPDLIYLLLPPNNIARYCLDYKKRNPNVKYYVDIIDMWPESLPIPYKEKLKILKFWKDYRNKSLINADHIFLECNLYKEKLKKYITDDKATINYLYKTQSIEEKKYIKSNLKTKNKNDNKIVFAYLGSINYIIDIDGIINLLNEVKNMNYDIEFLIIGEGNNRENFLNELRKNDMKFKYYGMIFDDKEKFDILNNCDFGINMMKNVSVGLTTKSIDYFSYGLPIINNIKGDTWKLVEQEKIGFNYDGTITQNDIEKILSIDRKHIMDIFDNNFTIDVFEEKINSILK